MRTLTRLLPFCGLAFLLSAAWRPARAEPAAAALLANSGFEDAGADGKPEAWSLGGKGAVVEDAGRAHGGRRFARVRFDDNASQSLPCEPETHYAVEGWVRAENPATKEMPRVKVYFHGGAGERLSVGGGPTGDPGLRGWARFALPLRAPRGAAKVTVSLIGAFGGADWFLFDDVTLRRVPVRLWPRPESVPDLNGKTVVVPDLADVHSFALYRVPPESLAPIDGLLETAAWTGRSLYVPRRPPVCDFDIRFGKPARVDWVLLHALSPLRGPAPAEVQALPEGRGAAGRRLLSIGPSEELIHSLRLPGGVLPGLRLRLFGAHRRTADIHEIQAFGIRDGIPAGAEGEPLGCGAPPADVARLVQDAFPGADDRQALVAGLSGDDAVALAPGKYLSLFAGSAGERPVGVKAVTLTLAARAPEPGLVEICVKQAAELDVNLTHAEWSDRGLEQAKTLKPRNYADLLRVVTPLSTSPLRISFDIPDVVLEPGERVWLTVRSERGLEIRPRESRVAVLACPISEALPEHLPRVRRLAVRCYSRETEAHPYSSRPYQEMILHRLVRRVLDYQPDDMAAQRILHRIAQRWFPVAVERPGPADAPDWAVWGRHAAREWLRIAHWWLDNRWVENGELGGDLNDDVEYTCHWPLIALITGDRRITKAQRAIADAIWEQTGESGYAISATDVEHAAEDSSCSLPQMLLCEYGNPVHVERMMRMSEHIPFWTGINDQGRRHFRSYIFSARMVKEEPKYDIDHLYCALAMCGAGHLAWYARNPQPRGWVEEYARAWAEVALSTEKGKPAGALPCDVHFKTGAIAPYTDRWNLSVYYSFGQYVMQSYLLGVACLTGDPLVQQAADAQLPSLDEAVRRTEEMIARRANPPRPDPANPAALDKTWVGQGDELSAYRAAVATGKKEYVVAMLQGIAEEFERTRFLTTEAEPCTDRVPVPGTVLLRHLFLGGDVAGKTQVPGLAVSWEGGGTDFAAFVLGASEDRLKVLLYSFAPAPLALGLRPWRLDHGRYEVTTGIDGDGDDAADRAVTRREATLFRHARLPIQLPPRQTMVVEIRQLRRLDPITARADLAISAGDLRREGKQTLAVTVHNIGAAPASNVTVRLVDTAGKPRARATLRALDPPADLKPKTVVVSLRSPQPIQPSWKVVVDPEGRVPEIDEENNALPVGAR